MELANRFARASARARGVLKTAVTQSAEMAISSPYHGGRVAPTAAQRELIEAVERGDANGVQTAIGRGADPSDLVLELEDAVTVTPLMYAAGLGHAAVVRVLIGSGILGPDDGLRGETPLMYAARAGAPETVETLLEAGAHANARDLLTGAAAIHIAAVSAMHECSAEDGVERYERVVQLLLKHGADPRLIARESEATAIDLLLTQNSFELAMRSARLVQAFGFDPDERVTEPWGEPEDAIDQLSAEQHELVDAIERGDAGTVGTLIRRGVDPTSIRARSAEFETPLTALMLAARNGNGSVVRTLIEEGGEDPDHGLHGETPITEAVWNGHPDTLRALLELGADPCSVSPFETPLHMAADGFVIADNGLSPQAMEDGEDWPGDCENLLDRYEAVCRLLIEHGVHPGAVDDTGETALEQLDGPRGELLAQRIRAAAREIGLDPDARVDTPSQDLAVDETDALIEAVQAHDADAAREAISQGADLHAWIAPEPDRPSAPLSLIAVAYGDAGVIRAMVEHGGLDPDGDAFIGFTPLAYSALIGRPEVLGVLLEHSKDPGGDEPLTGGNTLHAAALGVIYPDPGNNGMDPGGAIVDHQVFEGALERYAEVVDYLLEAGVDPAAVNEAGETPVDLLDAEPFTELADRIRRVTGTARRSPGGPAGAPPGVTLH